MPNIVQELRLACRHLMHARGFALTAILTLALGIGATTAIFSIVDAVLLRPLPFPHSDRLMQLTDTLLGADTGGNGEAGVTQPDIVSYTRDLHSFSSLGAYRGTGYELSGVGEPAMITAMRMTAGVFPALGVAPMLGRTFTAAEDAGHQQVVVLSYGAWHTRFHGDPNILGRKLLLDRNPYVVIGVMPRGFEFPMYAGLNPNELWVPMSFTSQELAPASAANWNFNMVGRLKPGVTHEQATADATAVAQTIMRNYPAFMAGFNFRPLIRPLRDEVVADSRPLLHTLFLSVGVVLLIACANLAGLLLVRAIRRRREIAVRLALGASAGTLLRQTMLESLVLSTTGGVLGLALAAVALRLGLHLLPASLPRISEIGLNWPVAGFAVVLALLTGLLCGSVPAFAAARTDVNSTLKEGGRTGSAGGHAWLRSGLVVAEVAVALVLLTASGLLLRSLTNMRGVNLGFAPEHLLVAGYSLPQKRYTTQAQVTAFTQEVRRRLEALPGVAAVGITDNAPQSGNNSNSAILPDGYIPAKPGQIDLATNYQVFGRYFQTMHIPLVRGRYFTDDDRHGTQLSVVINRKLAENAWPGQDPIGKRIRVGTPAIVTPWAVVVGEVENVVENAPDKPMKQQYYIPGPQALDMFGTVIPVDALIGNNGYIVLRTAQDPTAVENSVRSVVHGLDPQLALDPVQTMEEAVASNEAPRLFNTVLISGFAVAALVLAVLGIYSVIAFSAALRTQEMAIRIALGSQRTGIARLVLGSGVKLALVGCGVGLLGAAASAQLLHTLLFGVGALDPLTLLVATLFVLVLALGASLLPARRAATVDPMQALRAE